LLGGFFGFVWTLFLSFSSSLKTNYFSAVVYVLKTSFTFAGLRLNDLNWQVLSAQSNIWE